MGPARGTDVGPRASARRERTVCWRSTSPHVRTAVDQFPQFGPSGCCQRVCRSRVADAQVGKRVPATRARGLDGRAGAIVGSGVLGRLRPFGVGRSLVLGARCSHHGDILAATERTSCALPRPTRPPFDGFPKQALMAGGVFPRTQRFPTRRSNQRATSAWRTNGISLEVGHGRGSFPGARASEKAGERPRAPSRIDTPRRRTLEGNPTQDQSATAVS